ncbi:hypothetical protein K1719_041393 [Acacia pycnantha]|nr:hypothetical protein K1719_041393 [Acacia pycnantha]
MAVAPYTAASAQRIPSPPSSCRTMLYSGLKLKSGGPFGARTPNLTASFFAKVHKSLQWSKNHRPINARIQMMAIGTPKVPYKTPGEGTWQWIDLWNALYRERIVFIGETIDEEFSNQILATMLYLDSVDNSKKLYLYVNCPGGDLTPSLALYDTMQSLQSLVATFCMGFAYNLAAFIVSAGAKGNRTALPRARFVIEPPAGSARGQVDDIRNEANELLRINDYLYNELASKTGQPVETIRKDLKRKKAFSAQQAIEYGLIDRIIKPARHKDPAPRDDA